jgi:hypothetical protein
MGGAGNFQEFRLFNQPAFGHSPMIFAAVHCREKGRKDGVLRVLEGPVQNPHIYNQGRFGNGGLASGHEGLPHMESAVFKGEFPYNGEYYLQRVQWKNLKAGSALIKKLAGSGHHHDLGYTPEATKILRREGPKYQYGTGCISDGVMGQWLTTQLDLTRCAQPDVYPPPPQGYFQTQLSPPPARSRQSAAPWLCSQ